MNIQIIIGPSVSSGPSTASPLPFFSASAGAVRNARALPLTLTASGAAAAFIHCFFIVFQEVHGLVVPPRHVTFLPVRTGSSGRAAGKVKKHETSSFYLIQYNAYPLTGHN